MSFGSFGAGKQDVIQAEILPDGSLRITTDPISPANHVQAEALLNAIKEACGGESTHTHKHGKFGHTHSHGHSHHTH